MDKKETAPENKTATWKPANGIYWADMTDEMDYDALPWETEDLGKRPEEEKHYTLEDATPITGSPEETEPPKAVTVAEKKEDEAPAPPQENSLVIILTPEDLESDSGSDSGSDPGPGPVILTPEEDEFERFCEEQIYAEPPEVVVWWTPVSLPKSTTLVFSDPDLYLVICDFCRFMQNLLVDEKGRVVRTFCESCRALLSRHEVNHCTGGTSQCETFRYVDEVGAVAPLCRGCHRFEEDQRRQRRNGQRRGKRRGGAKQASPPNLVVKA